MIVVEHKTTSDSVEGDSNFWKKVDTDPQITEYFAALEDCEKVIYDVIRKITIKPHAAGKPGKPGKPTRAHPEGKPGKPAKAAETPDEYFHRCLEYVSNNWRLIYARLDVYRNERILEEHRKTIEVTLDTISLYHLKGFFPRHTDACVDRYHSVCEYQQLCAGYITEDALDKKEGDARALTTVSNSGMSCFRQCPRKYELRYIKRLGRAPKTQALKFGSLFHSTLEQWWRGSPIEEIENWLDSQNDSDPYDVAHAKALIIGYNGRWLGQNYIVEGVETEYDLKIPGTPYRRLGKLDAIVSEISAAECESDQEVDRSVARGILGDGDPDPVPNADLGDVAFDDL